MKKFILHWKTGKNQVVFGEDCASAINNAGIGAGALPALDYWEEIKASDNLKVDTEKPNG